MAENDIKWQKLAKLTIKSKLTHSYKKWPKMADFHQNWPKLIKKVVLVENWSNWPKLAENDKKWPKFTKIDQNCRKSIKMAEIDKIWPKFTKNGRNWPKITEIDQKWPVLTKIGRNPLKNGRKWPKITKNYNEEPQTKIYFQVYKAVAQNCNQAWITKFGGHMDTLLQYNSQHKGGQCPAVEYL